jgi:gliding motility-associated-like protein
MAYGNPIRPLTLLALALGCSAMAQNGNEDHPGLIQVEADRPNLGSAPSGGIAGDAQVSGLDTPSELAMKPVGLMAATAFTPDGDGLNDKFFPFFMGMNLSLSRFQVFDRWGRSLFVSTSGEGWDGTFGAGGAAMPMGVYVWRLEAWPNGSQDKLDLSGSVTLIR